MVEHVPEFCLPSRRYTPPDPKVREDKAARRAANTSRRKGRKPATPDFHGGATAVPTPGRTTTENGAPQ